MTVEFEMVPTIDVAGCSASAAESALALRDICHHVGFFYVKNHGVEAATIARFQVLMRKFFALPAAAKARIDKGHSPQFRGWEKLGSELTNQQVDFREQLDIGSERDALEHPHPFYRSLIGPNQWPDELLIPGFRAGVDAYLAELDHLSRTLLRMLSQSLGLPADAILDVFGAEPQPYCKLICYPPTPRSELGVGAHKDSGFLTLLLQDDVAGLEAQNAAGNWVRVPPVAGTFVVNIGELLQIMTHNYFLATPHRVINQNVKHFRYSSAYFYSPDLDTPLHPLPIAADLIDAAQRSPQHRDAGLMASHQDLLGGATGMTSPLQATHFGEKYWQRWVRSYPEIARKFYPERMP